MTKTTALKIVNPLIGILILNQVFTGLFSRFLHHGLFEIFHEGSGIVLFIGILVHLSLNMSWIKANYFRKK